MGSWTQMSAAVPSRAQHGTYTAEIVNAENHVAGHGEAIHDQLGVDRHAPDVREEHDDVAVALALRRNDVVLFRS